MTREERKALMARFDLKVDVAEIVQQIRFTDFCGAKIAVGTEVHGSLRSTPVWRIKVAVELRDREETFGPGSVLTDMRTVDLEPIELEQSVDPVHLVLRVVRHHVREIFTHEVDGALVFRGERPFDPHKKDKVVAKFDLRNERAS